MIILEKSAVSQVHGVLRTSLAQIEFGWGTLAILKKRGVENGKIIEERIFPIFEEKRGREKIS